MKLSNPSKEKGARSEREAAELLTRLSGYSCRRALGAGRHDDVGDIDGLPAVVQVTDRTELSAALAKLPDVKVQKTNANRRWGVLMVRRRGGKYIMVMEPDEWVTMMMWAERGVQTALSS